MQKGFIAHTLIFNQHKEILLLKRSANENVLPGYWDIPGGTLEDGEDPYVGAIRETLEETGITITQPHLFFCTSNVDQTKDKQFVRLIFLTQTTTTDVVLNPDDHDQYKWIKINDAEKLKLVDYLPDCFKLLDSKEHSLLKFN